MRTFLVGIALFSAGCDLMSYGVYGDLREKFASAPDAGTEEVIETPDAGTVVEEPSARPPVVLIPAGLSFQGCNGAKRGTVCNEPAQADELPYHPVRLASFELNSSEITRAQYKACIDAGSCVTPSCGWSGEADAKPVTCVTWHDASAYCAWVGMRLPTEAEWEYAAHGADRLYPWGDDAFECTRANAKNCLGGVEDVMRYEAGRTPEGAYDLAGNVAEWVSDWYDPKAYETSLGIDDGGPFTGTGRVVRGGAFDSDEAGLIASTRRDLVATTALPDVGFRCARSR